MLLCFPSSCISLMKLCCIKYFTQNVVPGKAIRKCGFYLSVAPSFLDEKLHAI